MKKVVFSSDVSELQIQKHLAMRLLGGETELPNSALSGGLFLSKSAHRSGRFSLNSINVKGNSLHTLCG